MMTDAVGTVSDPGAGAEFSAYVGQLAVEQDARKDSLEKRGLAVITTSGTLVTLLFGLVTLLTRSDEYVLPQSVHDLLGWALVAFVMAALLALLTNLPLNYANIDVAQSTAVFQGHWDDSQSDGRRRVVATRLKVLETAQSRNKLKGWLLLVGMLAEVAAVVLLSLAVGEVLRSS